MYDSRAQSAGSSVRKLTFGVTLLLTVLSLAAAGSRVSVQRTTPPKERFPAELDRYISQVLADWQIPGLAIAVVRNDSVLVAKGYGVRQLGRSDRVDENTV